MSRICGLVEPGLSETVVEQRLRRMCSAMADGTSLEFSTWTATGVGLAHFHRSWERGGAQPTTSESSQDALVVCGYVLPPAGGTSTAAKDEAMIGPASLLSYVQDGSLKGIKRLEGVFTFAHWDSVQRSLTLAGDRYGLRSPYICHDPVSGCLLFASDIRGIAESGLVDLGVDWASMTVFLHAGFYMGDTTCWDDVRVLSPGHVVNWHDGQVRSERFWSPEEIRVDEQLSHESAVEGIAYHFRRSMERCHASIRSPEIVFLSGGLDSRRIAAELRRLTGDFDTFTTRGFDLSAGDRILSKQVAERLGVPNTFVNLPRRGFLTEYWPRANELTGYETVLHQWLLPLVDSLPNRPMVNYDGLGGDIMVNGVQQTLVRELGGLEKLSAANENELLEVLTPPPLDLRHLSGELRSKLCYDAVFETVRREVRRFEKTSSPLTNFLLFNRTRRNIALAPLRLLDLRVPSLFPYYDHAFFDFLATIPLHLKCAHSLRRESLALLHKSLADIPNTKYIARETKTAAGKDDIRFGAQRRAFLLSNVRNYLLRNGWAFARFSAMSRSLLDVALRTIHPNHISPVFTASSTVFYEWLARFMPDGLRDR